MPKSCFFRALRSSFVQKEILTQIDSKFHSSFVLILAPRSPLISFAPQKDTASIANAQSCHSSIRRFADLI
ncbi:MAG TPA: hypothetical protein PKM07_10425, partial [Spirochaetota bacterium]|nr:hypothetical protein [Spirochaetota bacterium]